MEPENHLFKKENHLNQTFMTLGSMLIFSGVTFLAPENWPKQSQKGTDHLNQPLFFRGYCMSMLVFGGCIDVTNFLVEGFGFQGGGIGLQKQCWKMSIPIGSM